MVTFPPGRYSEHAWRSHKGTCEDLIVRNGYKSVCEIGGGRSPLFSLDEVAELGVKYTVMDLSSNELDHVPTGYRTLLADICDPALAELGDRFDFIFSRMVAEHVRDGVSMHRNTFALLRPGGQAFHFFPTLYSPVFVVNRLLPERLGNAVQKRFVPRRAPKFPAYYSLCRGPTKKMIRTLTGFGFTVEEYRPFYGSGYFHWSPFLRSMDDWLGAWAARRNNPYLTSFVFLRLSKSPLGDPRSASIEFTPEGAAFKSNAKRCRGARSVWTKQA
jgi:Methyltransferase domain